MGNHVEELLSAYLDNEVSAEERLIVDNHLPVCGDCQEKYHQISLYKEEMALLYHSLEEPSFQFEQSVMRNIKNLAPQKNEKLSKLQWFAAISSVVILALLLLKIGPVIYIGMKLTAVALKVAYTLIHVLAAVASSIPYFVTVTFIVTLIIILMTSWFLRQLLESKTIG